MAMGRARVSTHELIAGRYRLLEVVHREANRVSWSGEDAHTGRPCLIARTALPEEDDPAGARARRLAGRVVRTCETVQALCPGRIAEVIDAVVADGDLWTVTEWVDGVPLGELLERHGTFNHVRAARIGLELLAVLEAAHGQGVTHGELSPGQVFVREEGSVVVTGFGLAGATLAPRLGAPSYASPEQARDERIGPASDLWTLGALLYSMVEGRPPFRDRGRPEATLRGVDRLPLRTPVRAGPLAQAVQGLLRKNSRERLTRPVVRAALTRVLTEDPDTAVREVPRPRLRGACAAARHVSRGWSGRTMAAGTALAVVTVAVAVLAATHGLPGAGGDAATGSGRRPPSPAAPPAGESAPSSPAPPTSASPPSSPSSPPSRPGGAVPDGFRRYDAPEGFSVALPEGWRRLDTSRVPDGAYRVFFGTAGDPRALAVTYSERAGADPVAVWRDDVEPGLRAAEGEYRRIGEIRATTYRGRRAADMEWVARDDGDRVRTFGRGFLLGAGRSFSLRWTAPADDWEAAANEKALATVLDTFREDADRRA
ncbi:serine/threonine protein kinase [Streptomyces sp. NPDC057381]|uniref:serine/threonine protein kinase n=1 Tax=Streptomyces sp. NPDC057381 TaxID=3346111 RepID=UPI00363FC768